MKKNSLNKYSLDVPDQRDKIIAQSLNNNRFAQEMIYKRYFPVMEKLVMRYTTDDDQIIDIINDGFLRVFRKLGQFRGEGSFEGWIRRIVYHSVSNYFKKNSNDLKFLIYEDKFKKEPDTAAKHSLYYQDLMALIAELPEKHMQVFHLFAIDGYSHQEISDQLNMNKNTCRWYLSEARKILQQAYTKLEISNYNEAG